MLISAISTDIAHFFYPLLVGIRYGFPARKLQVIGITGTDGKSSSVILAAAMLREAGFVTAHYSSVSIHDGKVESPNDAKMTTPGRGGLQRFLAEARKNGATHAVLEITSQGIKQHRHRFIGFDVVGITNITPEHVEAHGGFGIYRKTKLSLLRALSRSGKRAVVIRSEDRGGFEPELSRCNANVYCVSKVRDEGYVAYEERENSLFATTISLTRQNEKVILRTKLGGPFASGNIAFAAAIALRYGASLSAIKCAAEKITLIAGRFEVVSERPFIIVDYGHTLAALAILLPYIRAHTTGKVVHVFGAAGGGRDRYKRPLLAKLSERYADISILTEENSFDEPIDAILDDIAAGFTNAHTVHREGVREAAVKKGLSLLTSSGDVLLLTAKGSESVIAGPNKSKRSYTERQFIRWILPSLSVK